MANKLIIRVPQHQELFDNHDKKCLKPSEGQFQLFCEEVKLFKVGDVPRPPLCYLVKYDDDDIFITGVNFPVFLS